MLIDYIGEKREWYIVSNAAPKTPMTLKFAPNAEHSSIQLARADTTEEWKMSASDFPEAE
jgi:hypothetical protein